MLITAGFDPELTLPHCSDALPLYGQAHHEADPHLIIQFVAFMVVAALVNHVVEGSEKPGLAKASEV